MSYDPTEGRWVEEDPAGYDDGPNRYQFVSGQPLVKVDPFGLQGGSGRPGPVRLTPKQDLAKKLKGTLSPAQASCQKCQDEADDIAKAIADAVASQPWQLPGGTGNFVSGFTGFLGGVIYDVGVIFGSGADQADQYDPDAELVDPRDSASTGGWGNQCGDWQLVVQAALAKVMQKYGKDSCFSASTVDGYTKADHTADTHNWVEITGPNGTTTIDPWPTGGAGLTGNSETSQYYTDPTLTHRSSLVPGSPSKPNPNPCSSCQPSGSTTRPSK
jgi:hypothetical protein